MKIIVKYKLREFEKVLNLLISAVSRLTAIYTRRNRKYFLAKIS